MVLGCLSGLKLRLRGLKGFKGWLIKFMRFGGFGHGIKTVADDQGV